MSTAPKSNSQIRPPVLRVCHPNTQWAAPLKTSSHPNNTVTAIPAAGGMPIGRIPARFISMRKPIDHPSDFFTITGMGVDVTLMSFLRRSLGDLINYVLPAGKDGRTGSALLLVFYFSSVWSGITTSAACPCRMMRSNVCPLASLANRLKSATEFTSCRLMLYDVGLREILSRRAAWVAFGCYDNLRFR